MIARSGAYIAFRRRFFIDCINDMIERIYSSLTGRKDDVYIELVSQIDSDGTNEEIYEKYKELLEDARETEIEKKCAVKGVHIDDMTFYVNRHNAKKFCSQGQQRILLLSVLFSQTEITVLMEN